MTVKLVLIALFSAVVCSANTITLAATGLPATDESGSYGSSDATYNGFAIATINGIPNQWILCDDAAHTTYVPSGDMIYDFSTIDGANPLQEVRFTESPEVQNYEEAGVLLWELFNYVSANGQLASGNTITDYQYAVWNIFDPYSAISNPAGVKVNTNQASLQTAAVNLVDNDSAMLTTSVYPNVRIYTPDPNGGSASNQEFLQYVPTPEPGSLAMLAGALLGAGAAVARRKVRKSRTA